MCPRGWNNLFSLSRAHLTVLKGAIGEVIAFCKNIPPPRAIAPYNIYIRRKASQRPKRNARSCLGLVPGPRSLAPGSYVVSAAAGRFYKQNWRTMGCDLSGKASLNGVAVPVNPSRLIGILGGSRWFRPDQTQLCPRGSENVCSFGRKV